ncbi:hypothetical protein KC331_g4091 [Hortaea werneckii]|nr:hypothetical protein KC331_g4091 [Hortaea werneckii]KAI7717469.1 hypothetical protein KC353_g4553 [Hortaea werneckii]
MHPSYQLYKILLALALPFASAIPQQNPATTSPEGANITGRPLGLPSCAEPALYAAILASGCPATDARSICSNPQLIPSLMDAVESACDVADRAAVAAFAKWHAIGHSERGHGVDNFLDDVFLERLDDQLHDHDGQPHEEYASQLIFFGQPYEWDFERSRRAAFGL